MSSVSPEAEFDFFDFVACARCRMPFALDNGSPTVPFWLTHCGHILCNSHLNPDQSCAQCGTRDVQLVPLQREMDAFAEYFQSIPLAFQSLSFAAKFQQDTMATQVRHYRSRHQQLRQLVERLKRDMADLKKENDDLRRENEQYRQHFQQPNDDSQYMINGNGKRRIVQDHAWEGSRPPTSSSSRSIHTPLAPNRLTLQPGQPVPELSSQAQNQRPVSSRSLEHYAYNPPESNIFRPQALTHQQAAPRTFQRTANEALQQNRPQQIPQHQTGPSPQHQQAPQILPPSSARFKPPAPKASTATAHTNPMARQPSMQSRKPTIMGPPPTPQVSSIFPPGKSSRPPANQSYAPPPSRQQFGASPLGTSTGQRPQSTAAPQRFFPSK